MIINLLILHKNICYDPSSERDSSDEGSQHKVLMRNKKKHHQILPLSRALMMCVVHLFHCHEKHLPCTNVICLR